MASMYDAYRAHTLQSVLFRPSFGRMVLHCTCTFHLLINLRWIDHVVPRLYQARLVRTNPFSSGLLVESFYVVHAPSHLSIMYSALMYYSAFDRVEYNCKLSKGVIKSWGGVLARTTPAP